MPNCLYITQDGQQGYLQLTDYKTKKTHGDDYIPLIKSSPLMEHLGRHISDYRQHLVQEKEHRYLFVVRINLTINITYTHYVTYMYVYISTLATQTERGNPFAANMWGSYIQGIFQHYTGHKIGPGRLRSIFCTFNEGREDLTENMKESLASCMKHTRKTVSTYITSHFDPF